MATASIPSGRKATRLILPIVTLLGVSVLVGLALEGYGMLRTFLPAANPSSTPSVKPLPNRVEALGRLEPEGGILSIGVSVPMGDRLRKVFVKEGDEVAKDQELARLESYDDRRAERDLAASQLDEARARLAAITTNGKSQIEEAHIRIQQIEEVEPLDIQAQETKVELLRDQLTRAKQNLRRLQGLQPDTVSRQEMDQQELLARQAEAELTSAEALLKKTRKGHALNLQAAQAQLKTLQTSLERLQQEIPLRSLEKSLQAAEDRLKHTMVRAPSAGHILKILAHAGEAVGSQPILRMADLRQMIALAEVYETDVGRVRVGQRATVRSRALAPEELSGTVMEVGRLIDRNYIFDLDPRADADRRVVAVKIRLDQSQPAAHFVNLQVTVSVQVDAAERPGAERTE
jgi:HlyD family secretion protein